MNRKQNQNQKHNRKRKISKKHQSFYDVVLSWSLSDILNKDLYKFQVEEIPLTFSCATHYMNSFIYLLFEETHADLLSQVTRICQSPASRIWNLKRINTGFEKDRLYNMTLNMTNYSPKNGDLIALTQVKPKWIEDLDRPNSPFITGIITKVIELVDQSQAIVQVLLSSLVESIPKSFVVYLTNLTTNTRIWEVLGSSGNMNIIQRTLSSNPPDDRNCDQCCREEDIGCIDIELRQSLDLFNLNTSQEAAVLTCLAANKCVHQTYTNLIWGPPGTGKTKTIASLLFVLLRMKHRTLTCAPTNIAVVGVVKRLLSLVNDHDLGCGTYGLGDIVIFGNQERMKIDNDHQELCDVFLDYRIDALMDCLSLWKYSLNEMILFLTERCRRTKVKSLSKKNIFSDIRKRLISNIKTLFTHLPTFVLSPDYAKKMYRSVDLLQKVDESLMEKVTKNERRSEAFLNMTECLQAIKDLQPTPFFPISNKGVELDHIPKPRKKDELKKFCLKNARLIFCTASSSIKLFRKGMTPIELVLIDEAAQLKECESIIPLKLPGVRNAVLVGDERQLPSMVQSKICKEAKYGRSLFERLVLLGHEKHLLNVQYRMHPSISRFPNNEFYDVQILDGPNVIDKARERLFLKGGMYGSFSFINVDSVNEEHDENHSTRNMVEVAIIVEIVANLYKESVAKKQTVTVGCISPYKAQVDAIQEKLGEKYNNEVNGSSFTLNVRSIDGFQGSEEDVIIFSTVRCNQRGSIGFLSSRERANVGLTRARHCLWVVGNKETMVKSGSVWNTLVFDAEKRGCVYNARDDKNLAQAMVHAMVDLNSFGSLLRTESILFKEKKWKVNFTNKFLKRITNNVNLNVRKLVVSLLVKLSSGWREQKKNKIISYIDSLGSSNVLEAYNVDGHLYLFWSVDVAYENLVGVQVLKFLDILPLSKIQQLAKCMGGGFGSYEIDTTNRCQTKRSERNLVFPMTWPVGSSWDDSTWALTSELAKLNLSNETGSGF